MKQMYLLIYQLEMKQMYQLEMKMKVQLMCSGSREEMSTERGMFYFTPDNIVHN